MSSDRSLIGYVEDDIVIRNNYVDLLQSDGYTVLAFDNRLEAQHALLKQKIDLALLDVELGEDKFGGLELCKELRKVQPDVPVIFLTSHTDIDMQSRGWRHGADDYVSKETELELVLLRIKALLSRYCVLRESFATSDAGSSKNLRLDESCYQAFWKGKVLKLSLTQFWILSALFKKQGDSIAHNELQSAANIFVEPNTIVAHIKSIRDQFKRIDTGFDAIKTERGKGYRWVD